MVYSYFPGCTLKNKAADLDLCGRRAAEALGAVLEEIPEWQCCGGVYPLSHDEIAVKLSSVRALAAAAEEGRELVTVCSACHNVIKQVNRDMAEDAYISERANNYLKADGIAYHGETTVLHYLELLRDRIGFDRVKEAVKNPLSGKKIGAYYGCLLLRPSNVMAMDNAENPSIMEDLVRAIGADPVIYAQRNECCGAYLTMEDPAIPAKRAEAILHNAKAAGAQMLITACPLCFYNLKKHAAGSGVEVRYFTEVLAEALGVKDAAGTPEAVSCGNASEENAAELTDCACAAAETRAQSANGKGV